MENQRLKSTISTGIQFRVLPCVADPGSGAFLAPRSGLGLMRIRDLVNPGSGMKKIGSGINIPDPQHSRYL
jgi:hypothetical protein